MAIEPEPFCELETTAETIAFFQSLWRVAGMAEECVRTHIGVCYDVCHQAVEFEDAREAIQTLSHHAIRINKVQISCAIQIDQPATNPLALAALKHYVEPKYLHQTFARRPSGEVIRVIDLTNDMITSPDEAFRTADCWRIHFHVPVNATQLGPLGTTRAAVVDALSAVARLDYAPHLEVETYTWEVLPGVRSTDLVEGLSRELDATRQLLAAIS